ncbi:hypothetical protein SPRG_15551 [Saprolegnia parasitica CBS 223.65]|uniref:Uncharacterized protein n=1 Tax=Saprolegnia parasitica (strain CBS 223.65) TaxID=695850 RepID=A0A067BY94_SAPPC|nr:hypothetical protein SPRG_15551 [Saprolegnia parasitica CBS 223.65]KDO19281.1 hypothetical protein SPRG_15551 [Saprolegnia parasitica CBS 223.65]|eukprot:XP_012210024.1 hypothetical protein SPRG_15551 [Saprolegnia parasitica CBS 223.65]
MSRLVVLTPESSPARLSTDSIALLASPPRRSSGRWRLLHLSTQGTAASRSIDSSRHDELDKVDDGVHALRRKRKLVLSLIALALVIVAISLAVIFTQANGRYTSNGDAKNNFTTNTLAPAAVESSTSTIPPQTSGPVLVTAPPRSETNAPSSPASVMEPVPEASATTTEAPLTVNSNAHTDAHTDPNTSPLDRPHYSPDVVTNTRADCSPDSSSNTTSEPTDDASTDSIAYRSTDYGTAFDPSSNANCVAYVLEVSRNGGKTWYDISVIPPGCGDGLSWDACSRGGTVTGYNVPLSVRPARVVSEASYNCVDVQCASEQCPDAYLFPSDNVKTKSCSIDEVLVATWC